METIKSMAANWWLVVLKGVVGVVLGLYFMANPDKSAAALVMLFGILIVVDSVISMVVGLLSIGKDKSWWLLSVLGLVGLLFGILVFNHPGVTIGLFFFLLSAWIIVSGIMMLALAVKVHRESYGSWFFAAAGGLALFFGVLIMTNPMGSTRIIMALAGLFVLISGAMNVAYGLELHRLKSDVKKLEA